MEAKWELIGTAAVDAGMLMISDPCYWIGEESPGQMMMSSMDEFVDYQYDDEGKLLHQIPFFSPGHAGLAVVTRTAHGDGLYPVYALKVPNSSRALAVIVVTDASVRLPAIETP